MSSTQSTHKRHLYFDKALKLVVQRCARKWTYEEFKECFPLFVEDDPSGTFAKYSTIQEYMENQIQKDLETIFDRYKLKDKLDRLDDVIHDARIRQQEYLANGEDQTRRKDEYPGGLITPRNAMCSRTVPRLEKEAGYLKDVLAKLEAENLEIGTRLEEDTGARDEADANTRELCSSIHESSNLWQRLPQEDYQSWNYRIRMEIPDVLRS